MIAVCPKNVNHKKFITTAHEVHDWIVDEKGEFVKDLGCLEISADPDSGNIWTCEVCGTEAVVED